MFSSLTHQNVTQSLTEILRKTGVRSLRQSASTPLFVAGDNPMPGPPDLLQIVLDLRSSKMANLRKRLAGLEWPMDYLREHWRTRMERIEAVSSQIAYTPTFCLYVSSIEFR